MADSASDVTLLLQEYGSGDRGALDRLIPILYTELRQLARHCVGGRDSGSAQPTSLVHEAWLRLAGRNASPVDGRHHFYGLAATVMRQILVDRARARLRLKRGGGGTPVTFDEALMAPDAAPEQVVELDDALQALHSMDPRKAKIVELRYFGGLSVEETAEVMELSTATVGREMRLARAWLLTQLAG